MATYKMKDVKLYVDGKEISFADLAAKCEEQFRTLETNARKVEERLERFRDAIGAVPVDTYIGDPGPSKKKAQWKQEQRRFRK